MRSFFTSFAVAWSVLLMLATASRAGDRLIVHEWGTFTALQDERGRAIAGINTDDEPLPPFVHNLNSMLLQGPGEVPTVYFKGAPRVHPDVVVRLETPVVYFYPPKGATLPMTVDVDVALRGGWLTQFYPDAVAGAPGLDDKRFEFGPLDRKTVGTLAWRGLKIGGAAAGPETTSPAWLAPRQVPAAASVVTPGGERERYLFYRGVGNFAAPLSVTRDDAKGQLSVFPQFGGVALPAGARVGPMWLVDVRPDGSTAFARFDPAALPDGRNQPLAVLPSRLSEADYGDHLADVRKSLHIALVDDGLYADEADALLNTWETSYFKRPGQRLFFLVPRAWTDHTLPLRISGDPQTSRVMVGRIELVTPRERELMKRIAAGPVSDPQWVRAAMLKANAGREDYYREDWYRQVMDGTRQLSSLNLEMPDDYRAYLELGRFRNALILDENAARPSENLKTFIDRYDLAAHRTKAEVR